VSTVTVNPPKTPVTEKSNGTAPAGPPNMCKMPGPPAPFVPAPLPNIGQSSDNLTDCTTTVKIEGAKVAIKGSYFMSKGDMASKGTGGGMVSATTHGKTEFVGPGSMDVKFQGKMVQFLGDAMTNNGNIANAATIKELQDAKTPEEIKAALTKVAEQCNAQVNRSKKHKNKDCQGKGIAKHKCCEDSINKEPKNPKLAAEAPFNKNGTPSKSTRSKAIAQGSRAKAAARRAGVRIKKLLNEAFKRGFGRVKGMFSAMPPINLDVAVFTPPPPPTKANMEKIYDFKFPCPSKEEKKKMKDKPKSKTQEMRKDQLDKYQDAFPGVDVETIVVF
jgi:uncharacterized Zn-binding protein involved in type VI secretion